MASNSAMNMLQSCGGPTAHASSGMDEAVEFRLTQDSKEWEPWPSKSLSARAAALIVISCLSATALIAQTAIKLPKNHYTPQQDVELGREAAAEVRKQYPIIKDERIADYLTRLGDRLVAAAPAGAEASRSTSTRSRR